LALATLPLACGGQVAHPAGRSTGGPHIYSVSTDGSNVRPLNVAGIGLSRGPDGRIAFLQGSRLAVMNDDGTGVRLLAHADRAPKILLRLPGRETGAGLLSGRAVAVIRFRNVGPGARPSSTLPAGRGME